MAAPCATCCTAARMLRAATPLCLPLALQTARLRSATSLPTGILSPTSYQHFSHPSLLCGVVGEGEAFVCLLPTHAGQVGQVVTALCVCLAVCVSLYQDEQTCSVYLPGEQWWAGQGVDRTGTGMSWSLHALFLSPSACRHGWRQAVCVNLPAFVASFQFPPLRLIFWGFTLSPEHFSFN